MTGALLPPNAAFGACGHLQVFDPPIERAIPHPSQKLVGRAQARDSMTVSMEILVVKGERRSATTFFSPLLRLSLAPLGAQEARRGRPVALLVPPDEVLDADFADLLTQFADLRKRARPGPDSIRTLREEGRRC